MRTVKTDCYLVLNARGVARMTKNRPTLSPSELGVRLKLTYSDQLFKPRPMPDVTIDVPDAALIEPVVHVEVEGERKVEARDE